LDDGALIFDVEFENAIHAREDEHHAAGACERAAGKSRAGAATDDGDVILCRELCDARNVFGGMGENDEVRTAFFDGAVVLIKKKILGPVKNGEGPRSSSNSRTRPEFIGRRLRRTWNYSENSGTRATPSYGGSAAVC